MYKNLDLLIGKSHCAVCMKPLKPVFSLSLLEEIAQLQEELAKIWCSKNQFKYLYWYSNFPGVFSWGGDLEYFVKCWENNDLNSLREYDSLASRVNYTMYRSLNLPIITFCFVNDNCEARGGGFEFALAFDLICAPQTAKFSFPEPWFGSFPGMGGLALLREKYNLYGEQIINLYNNKNDFSREIKACSLWDSFDFLENTNLIDILNNKKLSMNEFAGQNAEWAKSIFRSLDNKEYNKRIRKIIARQNYICSKRL